MTPAGYRQTYVNGRSITIREQTDVIVLGGGLSNVRRLYRNVSRLWPPFVFSDRVDTRLVRARHGDSSGVRGAARLWPEGGESR